VLGNWMLTTCAATLFGRSFQDMLSGYRIFSRRFAKSFPAQSQGFEIETELTVHALRLRLPVAEVDTKYFARPEGSHSKLSTWRDGFRILWMIARLMKSERPFALFSLVAALCGVLSVGLATPIWMTFLETGLVPRLPTAVLCAALAIVAVIALVCGILLDAVTAGRLEARHAAYLAAGEPISLDHLPPAIASAPTVASSRVARAPLPEPIQRALTLARSLQTIPAMGVTFALCLGVIASVFMRQDFSWDLQNYHLYNAWAFLNDRRHVDLAPAMFQSYFNPLLDLPQYWMSVSLNWNARWVAFVIGCFHGLAGFATFLVARRSEQHSGDTVLRLPSNLAATEPVRDPALPLPIGAGFVDTLAARAGDLVLLQGGAAADEPLPLALDPSLRRELDAVPTEVRRPGRVPARVPPAAQRHRRRLGGRAADVGRPRARAAGGTACGARARGEPLRRGAGRRDRAVIAAQRLAAQATRSIAAASSRSSAVIALQSWVDSSTSTRS
jgi:hypothetical protein